MSLAVRVIPCLDVKDGRVVKGVQFEGLRDAGDPAEQAKAYDAQGADEICFLDISASQEGRGTLLDAVARTAEHCFIPLSVGGGVRSLADVRALLRAGADKAAINTAAVQDPELIARIHDAYGAQCLIVAIDAKQTGPETWEIFTHGGRKETGLDAVEFAARAAKLGAGELLVTSIDRDGAKTGYDLGLLAAITRRVSIPVIASGGAGSVHDLPPAVLIGGASAVLAASIFHFGEASLSEAKAAMAAAGISVRAP